MSDLVVYTCCTGGFDVPKAPAVDLPGVEWVAFTDDPDLPAPPPWRVAPVPRVAGMDARRLSRLPKLSPQAYLPGAAQRLWLDAYFRVVGDVRQLVRDHLGEADAAFRPHKEFRCAYDLAEASVRRRVGDPEQVRAEAAALRRSGWPAGAGLWGGGVVASRSTVRARWLFQAWLRRWLAGSGRDELSLPAAIAESGAAVAALPSPSRPRRGLYRDDQWLRYEDRTPYAPAC